jgi:hypothetical protein
VFEQPQASAVSVNQLHQTLPNIHSKVSQHHNSFAHPCQELNSYFPSISMSFGLNRIQVHDFNHRWRSRWAEWALPPSEFHALLMQRPRLVHQHAQQSTLALSAAATPTKAASSTATDPFSTRIGTVSRHVNDIY